MYWKYHLSESVFILQNNRRNLKTTENAYFHIQIPFMTEMLWKLKGIQLTII